MKCASFLAAVLVLCTGTSYAQMGFGAEVGFNSAKDIVKAGGTSQTNDPRYGLRVGALADFALTDNFFFQPGVCYVSNGFKNKYLTGYHEFNYNELEIPLNIEYKIGPLGANRLFVGAGPYVGINISGYAKTHSQVGTAPAIDSKRDLNIGGGVTNDIKSLDAGLGANIGYQITAGLFIRARTQVGLVNMAPLPGSDNSIKTFSFGATLGYIMYRRDKDGKITINRERKKEQKLKSKKWRSDKA